MYWSHNRTTILTRSFLANQRMILPFPDRPLRRHFRAALIHSIKVNHRRDASPPPAKNKVQNNAKYMRNFSLPGFARSWSAVEQAWVSTAQPMPRSCCRASLVWPLPLPPKGHKTPTTTPDSNAPCNCTVIVSVFYSVSTYSSSPHPYWHILFVLTPPTQEPGRGPAVSRPVGPWAAPDAPADGHQRTRPCGSRHGRWGAEEAARAVPARSPARLRQQCRGATPGPST